MENGHGDTDLLAVGDKLWARRRSLELLEGSTVARATAANKRLPDAHTSVYAKVERGDQ